MAQQHRFKLNMEYVTGYFLHAGLCFCISKHDLATK